MNEGEDFTEMSVWVGSKYISIGDTRTVGGKRHEFRKLGGVPLFNSFIPVLLNSQVPVQERKLFIPGVGDTGKTVKIFFSDLYGDKYYAMSNPQDMYVISSLKRENEALQLHIEKLYNMVMSISGEDRMKKHIKTQMDYFNQIKGYGNSYGGYPSFGANIDPAFSGNMGE